MQLVYALLIYCKGNTIHREKRNILRFSVLKITQVENTLAITLLCLYTHYTLQTQNRKSE